MIAIDRIGCALRSIAAQAPTCSSRRRGPSAIATVRNGLALGRAGCPGSTTATDAPCPIACLIAAASASPDAPPPAMTTSKIGAGSANADASFRPIVARIGNPYRVLGRRAISESGFHLFKGLRRHLRVTEREVYGQIRTAAGRRRPGHPLARWRLSSSIYSLTRIFLCDDIWNEPPDARCVRRTQPASDHRTATRRPPAGERHPCPAQAPAITGFATPQGPQGR